MFISCLPSCTIELQVLPRPSVVRKQQRTMMPAEMGRCIFFQLPLGHTAGRANPFKPLVAKPSRSPAVSGVADHESFVAVGGDPGLIAHGFNRLDAVKQPFARRPDLDFCDQPEQLHPFSVKASLGRFGLEKAVTHAESLICAAGLNGSGCS